MNTTRVCFLIAVSAALMGCKEEADSAFMAKCRSNTSFTSTQCSCISTVINQNLPEPGNSYVKALILGDEAEANRLYARIGMLQRAHMSGHAGAAVRRASTECGVQFS